MMVYPFVNKKRAISMTRGLWFIVYGLLSYTNSASDRSSESEIRTLNFLNPILQCSPGNELPLWALQNTAIDFFVIFIAFFEKAYFCF